MAEENQNPKIDHGKRLASWTFHEFPQHKRGKWWYIGVAIVLIGLIVYALVGKNYLFVVILALAAFIYTITMQRRPRLITFAITEDGLEVHESFYSYKDIEKFWIIYDPPEVKTLYIQFTSKVQPILSVSLETQNPIVIRDLLLQYLKEDLERDEELLSDAVQRSLKL